jgi:hypothetical protein
MFCNLALKGIILKVKVWKCIRKDITGHIGTQKYLYYYLRNGQFIMDEPKSIEGKTLARSFSTLLASLPHVRYRL